MAVPFVGFLRGRVGPALGLRVEILASVPGGMLTIEGAFRARMDLLDGVHIGWVVVLVCTVVDKFSWRYGFLVYWRYITYLESWRPLYYIGVYFASDAPWLQRKDRTVIRGREVGILFWTGLPPRQLRH